MSGFKTYEQEVFEKEKAKSAGKIVQALYNEVHDLLSKEARITTNAAMKKGLGTLVALGTTELYKVHGPKFEKYISKLSSSLIDGVKGSLDPDHAQHIRHLAGMVTNDIKATYDTYQK